MRTEEERRRRKNGSEREKVDNINEKYNTFKITGLILT